MKNYWMDRNKKDFNFDKEIIIDGITWKVYARDILTDVPAMLDPETFESYKPLCKVFVTERNAIAGDSFKKLPIVIKGGQSIPCQHMDDPAQTKTIET